MTLSEIAQVGKECLIDYHRKGRLKVLDFKPNNDGTAETIHLPYETHISRVRLDHIKQEVETRILDRLAELNGFVMSERFNADEPSHQLEMIEIDYDLLRLSFSYGCSMKDGCFLHIQCWYWPK